MRPEVENRNKDSVFHGPYAGRDLYITMYQDSEREFVVTHNANIKPVSYFTGRETELKELRQRVEEGRKSVLVSGMGGIGKTHICRKLFEEYLNKHAEGGNCPFRHIGYIEYSGDMGGSLQNCLKFRQQEKPEQNQEAAWKELEYLASDGKLLLFVDNVDRPIGEDAGLQRLRGIPGAVVMTSRQASFSDEFEPYRIGFLGMEQCKEIYGKIRFEGSRGKVNPEDVGDLEYIIENLVGRHTITVELLAHLARTKLWTVKRLREELEQKGFRLTFHKGGEFVNIQESYEKLYDLSGLTEAEQNILEAFSVFPYIPLAAETCNEWLLADAGVNEDEDILMGLYQKGWLQFDAGQEGYALHPVFAQFIYERCKPTMEKHTGLIAGCRECLQIPESSSALERQKYAFFAENLIEKLDMGNDLEQVGFVPAVAYLSFYLVEYKKGEGLYERYLRQMKKVLGEDHPSTATGYNNPVVVHKALKEYEKAEELYEKNLRIIEKVLGENHPDTAIGYNNVAVVYKVHGEYEKAGELYEKSLRIREKVLGEDHPDTIMNYYDLAVVYKAQGEYEKVEELYEKLLRIVEKVLREDHPNEVVICNILAMVFEGQGKYEKAVTYCLKAYISLRFRSQIALGKMETLYSKWKPEGNFNQWLEEQMKK